MAHRLNFYHLIRKIHLFAAFTIMAFLVMYFVTGFVMTHEDLFNRQNVGVNTKAYALSLPSGIPDEDIFAYIQHRFDLRGPTHVLNVHSDGGTSVSTERPGWRYDITITPSRDSVKITTTDESAYRTFTVFHRIHGYGHGWVYNIYAFMMDLSGLALLTFVVSGFYMWWKLFRKKVWGVVFLAVSISYTAIVIATLMTA